MDNLENSGSKTFSSGQRKPDAKDVKKIRSLVAKYRNKSSVLTTSSIEQNILKSSALDNRNGKYKLGDLE